MTLPYATLFCLGLLAGIEFFVMFGLRGPLKVLAAEPQIILRQALVRQLRVVVPMVAMTALALSAATTVREAALLRYDGLGCMVVWMAATVFGTVPINKALLTWKAEAPPANWRARIRLWEHLDTVRMLTAVGAFGLFLSASAGPGPSSQTLYISQSSSSGNGVNLGPLGRWRTDKVQKGIMKAGRIHAVDPSLLTDIHATFYQNLAGSGLPPAAPSLIAAAPGAPTLDKLFAFKGRGFYVYSVANLITQLGAMNAAARDIWAKSTLS